MHEANSAVTALASIQAAEHHVETEYEEEFDVPRIMATVTEDATFIKVDKQGGVETAVTDKDVWAFYERLRLNFKPMGTIHLGQVVTDWYTFFESVPRRLDAKTGKTYRTSTAALFPTIGGRIAGEINCEIPPDYDGSPSIPSAQALAVNHACAYETFVSHLVTGNVQAAGRMMHPEGSIVVRHGLLASCAEIGHFAGAKGQADFLGQFAAAIEDVEVCMLNRLVNGWMVFSEVLISGRLKAPVRRLMAGNRVTYAEAHIAAFDPGSRLRQLIMYSSKLRVTGWKQGVAHGGRGPLRAGRADHGGGKLE